MKTITIKQSDKAVFEVLQEIKRNGWGRGGNVRMLLQVGAQKNITREQASILAKYMERGQEQCNHITEALERDAVVKLEETEISFAEAMHRMNEELGWVRIVSRRGDEKEVRRYFDLVHLKAIGICDFDDLHHAKFFAVTK